jgi:hypothetical protein
MECGTVRQSRFASQAIPISSNFRSLQPQSKLRHPVVDNRSIVALMVTCNCVREQPLGAVGAATLSRSKAEGPHSHGVLLSALTAIEFSHEKRMPWRSKGRGKSNKIRCVEVEVVTSSGHCKSSKRRRDTIDWFAAALSAAGARLLCGRLIVAQFLRK